MALEVDRLADDLFALARIVGPNKGYSDSQLIDEFMARLRPWGVEYAACSVMADGDRNFKPGPRFGIWHVAGSQSYFDNKMYEHDPVIEFALTAERGEYWDRSFANKKLGMDEQRVLDHAAAFGVRDGLLVPMPLFNGDIVVTSFQGDKIERDPDVEAFLRGVAIYFGNEAHRRQMAARVKSGEVASLTKRQTHVLHLSALGYRNDDIADELGLSLATVKFHLASARKRIGARNTKEAIAMLHAFPPNLFET